MLILTRRPGESLRIEPEGAVPTEADPFGWFADGPIRVSVTGVHHGQVRIGIQAPPALRILGQRWRGSDQRNPLSTNRKVPTCRVGEVLSPPFRY